MDTKIVAFLQNQWFKYPDRIERLLSRYPSQRQQILRRTLFAGCLTGRRLKAICGEWCDEIHWEEASRKIGGESGSVFPADKEHIRAVLYEQNPDLVLCFGKIAQGGVDGLWNGARLDFPHPAARNVTEQDLKEWRSRFFHVVRVDTAPIAIR